MRTTQSPLSRKALPGEQTLEIVLATHKAQYKIDQAYFESTGAMFHEADEGLKAANEAMRNESQ